MAHKDSMGPIYAKIIGNDTVQPIEDNSLVLLQLGEFCVNIKTAGGSVTIEIKEEEVETDTLSPK